MASLVKETLGLTPQLISVTSKLHWVDFSKQSGIRASSKNVPNQNGKGIQATESSIMVCNVISTQNATDNVEQFVNFVKEQAYKILTAL